LCVEGKFPAKILKKDCRREPKGKWTKRTRKIGEKRAMELFREPGSFGNANGIRQHSGGGLKRRFAQVSEFDHGWGGKPFFSEEDQGEVQKKKTGHRTIVLIVPVAHAVRRNLPSTRQGCFKSYPPAIPKGTVKGRMGPW